MYITDNTELRGLIPNVMKEVTGETTLYDKLTPYMLEVEDEFDEKVKGTATIPDGTTAAVKRYIANKSFKRALPSLDLILTPNGFGIVSNSTVAPASKERVESLRQSLTSASNKALITVCRNLMNVTGAAITTLQKRSIFPTLGICYTISDDIEPDDILIEYEKAQNMFAIRENAMAEKFVSQEIMEILRTRSRGGTTTDDTAADALLGMMRMIEIRDYKLAKEDLICGLFPERELRQVVEYIRGSSFKTTWEESATGLAWGVERYENNQESGGYWL